MEYKVPALDKLVSQFMKLPSVGIKTAQKMAFQVLDMPESIAEEFASAISEAHKKIKKCDCCLSYCEGALCPVCSSPSRDKGIICVVESPKDVIAFERTGEFTGVYHVLHGLISPIDNIGPDDIYIGELIARVEDKNNPVREVIMATNPTSEGEATAMYISSRILKPRGVKVTRLAYGIPIGSNLEYADEMTLSRALGGRSEF